MQRVAKEEKIVITKRDQPIADVVSHRKQKTHPGWSLKMPKLKIKGLTMSQELLKFRRQERS